MATLEWLPPVIRRLRRGPLMPPGTGTAVAFGTAALERLLPHRAPMLLVDGIEAVDVEAKTVRGYRLLRPHDLGFAGHFPGEPVYPGVLLVEAMAQLGLTLLHFAARGTSDVSSEVRPMAVKATHLHHATFQAPARPGDQLVLHATVIESGLTLVAAGQVFTGDTLAAYAVVEAYIDE